jgi:hypothetical protein
MPYSLDIPETPFIDDEQFPLKHRASSIHKGDSLVLDHIQQARNETRLKEMYRALGGPRALSVQSLVMSAVREHVVVSQHAAAQYDNAAAAPSWFADALAQGLSGLTNKINERTNQFNDLTNDVHHIQNDVSLLMARTHNTEARRLNHLVLAGHSKHFVVLCKTIKGFGPSLPGFDVDIPQTFLDNGLHVNEPIPFPFPVTPAELRNLTHHDISLISRLMNEQFSIDRQDNLGIRRDKFRHFISLGLA